MSDETAPIMATKQAFHVVGTDGVAYWVPKDVFAAYGRKPNKIANAAALKELLASGTVEDWFPFCHPDCIWPLFNDDHHLNFTIFTFTNEEANLDSPPEGQAGAIESQLIQYPTRMQPAFKQMSDSLDGPAKKAKENSGKQVRIEALDWTRDGSMPAFFDYKGLGWLPVSDEAAAKEALGVYHERQKQKVGYDASEEQQAYDKGIARIQHIHDTIGVYSEHIPGTLCCGVESASVGVAVANEPSTALVVQSVPKHVPFSLSETPEMHYSFGRNLWAVNPEKMLHYPTKKNVITAPQLAALKDNRTAAAWKPYLHPATLGKMIGHTGAETHELDAGSNLFTTFHVLDDDGHVMASMSDKISVPNQDLLPPILKEYSEQFAAGNDSLDMNSTEVKKVEEYIFGWPDDNLNHKKLDVKHNGGTCWKKVSGAYVSPLPKLVKPSRQSKSANDGAPGTSSGAGTKKLPLDQATSAAQAASSSHKTYCQTIIGEGPLEATFVLEVGAKYSIAPMEMCPPGMIVIHKYRDDEEEF